ncbi:MAG TPA: 30S ribosomal protein S6 [Beutenbergiaceae bacterium]|nr:30S ribosomal protein S6 [Beutenbergiaceae bacterium]
MRNYELMVIFDPEIDERAVTPAMEKFLAPVKEGEGTYELDVWGSRRLAYEINKRTEGVYVVTTMTATSDQAQEVDRQLRLSETVLRTKLIRKDA